MRVIARLACVACMCLVVDVCLSVHVYFWGGGVCLVVYTHARNSQTGVGHFLIDSQIPAGRIYNHLQLSCGSTYDGHVLVYAALLSTLLNF